MNLNIHPVFVHFPIAFLLFYSVLELATLTPLKKIPQWFWTKAVLLFIGTASAYVTLQTGEMAEQLLIANGGDRNLVEMHSLIASVTTWLFTALAIAYACEMYLQNTAQKESAKLVKFHPIMQKFAHLVLKTPLVYVLALAGLIGISTTGALGGALVYGPNADPFVHLVYSLLIGN